MEGYLCLQDGRFFKGTASQNWEQPLQGEIVFFTGMTGYQEVLTDPSYKGQIVVFTYPLIGNYGINEHDSESDDIQVSGVVMAHCTHSTSHYQATISLNDYLNKHDIPFLTDVDTREVTKAIRAGGTRQATLATSLVEPFSPPQTGQVYKTESEEIKTYGQGSLHLALIDFGWKKSILTSLLEKGVQVTVVPFTKVSSIDFHPDGIVLSNGPGNPKDVEEQVGRIKELLESYPSFGICMGHQVVALAYGADTKKLSFGHRGANHPVKDVVTGKVFLSSQNHNYVVDESSLKGTPLTKRFYNVNDGSIEGLAHSTKPILSVQFHPEAHPGPVDAQWLFEDFFALMKSEKEEKVYV